MMKKLTTIEVRQESQEKKWISWDRAIKIGAEGDPKACPPKVKSGRTTK